MKIGPVQRQSLISLASLVGVTVVSYLATIYFAHFLGPTVLGAFYLFTAYYAIFDIITSGGFGLAAIKRISEGKEQNEFFTASIIIRFILLVFSILVFVIISPYLVGISSAELFYLFIFLLIAGSFNAICSVEVQGTARIGINQTSNFINTIVKLLVQVLTVFIGWGLGGLVVGFIAGLLAAAILNYKFIRLKLTKCNLSHFRDLSSYAFWTFLSSSGMLFFSNADTILISMFLSVDEVGIYRVAFQLATVSAIAVTALNSVLFPRISRWHTEQNYTMISQVVSKAITYCLILTVPITVGGILLSDKLMYFLYGESFESGFLCLIILLLAEIANIFMSLFTMCLNSVDKPRESFIVMAVTAVLNIVLNLLLIPVYGINGAAAAMLGTMIINAILAYTLLRPVFFIPFGLKQVGNMIFSSIVMAGVLLIFILFIRVETFVILFVAIMLGAIVYFGLLLKIDGSIQADLRNMLKEMSA